MHTCNVSSEWRCVHIQCMHFITIYTVYVYTCTTVIHYTLQGGQNGWGTLLNRIPRKFEISKVLISGAVGVVNCCKTNIILLDNRWIK